jgi:LacI family transcriptional regulator
MQPPLTSVAQNGYLIGETAARLAIRKIESGSRQSVRHILPTQLVARKSCGEGMNRV